ncbi:hypothetical protein SAMN02910358_02366 [Lachnospiraceae bacterium XBB1006]|nr:hypothetical protein SAMN02910358_02366 [Lachnospiraceae bacterium XBB1006]
MRKRSYLILCCIVLFSICGCSKNETSKAKEAKKVEMNSEESNFETKVDLPDFLHGYLDNGSYEQFIRIANPENVEKVVVSSDNRLEFPEMGIMAVVSNRWGDSLELKEKNSAK